MTNVKARLEKIEAAIAPPVQWRVSIILIDPNFEGIRGFECDGISTMRLPGESLDDLERRCTESARWQGKPYYEQKIFHPIMDSDATPRRFIQN